MTFISVISDRWACKRTRPRIYKKKKKMLGVDGQAHSYFYFFIFPQESFFLLLSNKQ